MKSASTVFLQQIKKQVRQLKIKIVINGTLTLTNDDLNSCKIRTEGERHIGGIEYKAATLVANKKKLSSLIDTEITAQIHIGINNGNTLEYVDLGVFLSCSWKADPDESTVTVELWGKTNSLVDGSFPNVDIIQSTTVQDFTKLLVPDAQFEGLNGSLQYGYMPDSDKRSTLVDLAKSVNSLLVYEDTPIFKNYSTARSPVDTLPESARSKLQGGANGARAYHSVNIAVSNPYKTEVKELGKLENISLPASTSDILIGEIQFNNPVQVTQVIISGSDSISVGAFNLSNRSLSISISNSGSATVADVLIYGSELDFTKTSNNTANQDKNVLDYHNPYIQDESLVSRIDTGLLIGRQLTLQYTGNPAYEIGDIINIENVGKVQITLHELDFAGGLKGRLEGVLIDG